MIEERTVITCDVPGCEEQYMIGETIYLAVLQAKTDGWRISQDGSATCFKCATGTSKQAPSTKASEKSMADVQREGLMRALGVALMQAEKETATFDLLSHLYFALHQVSIDATNDVKSPSGMDEGETRFGALMAAVEKHLVEHGDEYASGLRPFSTENELPF